ncbi:nitroreductase [Thermodesulfatator indicus DSM 15286]|uniref:Nitroreductase n=1 Tax=Thermodesulfatator indicus (strain DSM 15286 / JCM 11887 / CIR29812) TaxID=667014 RepID=F8ADY4_THEID|nr:nitroreductase family protein [Thermodesulfatator indicus]AEH44949.1 nitroreductase [Thermodesulfatator indicus DSM 15286]
MNLEDLILKCRSYRRFDENYSIKKEELLYFIKLARLAASAGNLQPLKYILSCEKDVNQKIFSCLRWAAYLKDWPGPAKGERPTAYIVVLGDKDIAQVFGVDAGLATQNILLGAVEKGLGGCIIASLDRETLRENLNIPPRFEMLHVIALGKPAEKVVIEDIPPGGDIKYFRDDEDIHHVPKRPLEELILDIYC